MNEIPVTSDLGPKKGRSRKGLRVALVLSLMVNVLLVGVLAGGMMRMARFEDPGFAQPDFRSLWRALPPQARAELHAMSRGPGEPGRRPSREERRARADQVNARIVDMLRGDPFDGDAFAALLGSEREALSQRLTAAQAAFAGRVAGLTHAERVEMAETLAQDWGRHQRH